MHLHLADLGRGISVCWVGTGGGPCASHVLQHAGRGRRHATLKQKHFLPPTQNFPSCACLPTFFFCSSLCLLHTCCRQAPTTGLFCNTHTHTLHGRDFLTTLPLYLSPLPVCHTHACLHAQLSQTSTMPPLHKRLLARLGLQKVVFLFSLFLWLFYFGGGEGEGEAALLVWALRGTCLPHVKEGGGLCRPGVRWRMIRWDR